MKIQPIQLVNKKEDSSAYLQGKEHFMSGGSKVECPYPFASDDHAKWMMGWKDAKNASIIYKEGFDAILRGDMERDNPYDKKSAEGKKWLMGLEDGRINRRDKDYRPRMLGIMHS
jgi:ribosome modulation factor